MAQKKPEKAREALRDNQRKQEAANAMAANSAQKVERAGANLLAIQRAERGEAAQPQKKRRVYNQDCSKYIGPLGPHVF